MSSVVGRLRLLPPALVFVGLLSGAGLVAQQFLSGGEFFLYGNAPSSLGLGGAFSTKTDSIDGLADNPIKNPDMLNRRISVHYIGLNNGYHGYGLSYSEPNAYGVLSFLYQGMRSDTLDLRQANSLQLAFSKRMSRHYLFGTKLNMDVVSNALSSDGYLYGIHMDFNLVVVQDASQVGDWRLGRREFSFHARHLGLVPSVDVWTTTHYYRLPEFRLGAGLDLFGGSMDDASGDQDAVQPQQKAFDSKAMVDLVFLPTQLKFHFHSGLEFGYDFGGELFKRAELHLGFLLLHDSLVPNKIGPLTGGLQGVFSFLGRLVSVQYALVPGKSNTDEGLYHVFSINFAAAYRDQEGPEIETFSD